MPQVKPHLQSLRHIFRTLPEFIRTFLFWYIGKGRPWQGLSCSLTYTGHGY